MNPIPPDADRPKADEPADSQPPQVEGPPSDSQPPAPPPPDIGISGPLDRSTAVAFLGIADRLLTEGDAEAAGGYYQRVIGFDEPAITAAAFLGLGNVLYRLDREGDALRTWQQVPELGETPSTYPAWRQIAAALVREGDLQGAIRAYREADRRAPAADKTEIASRLGWLAKETGNTRAAGRYFARSRGATGLPIPLTYIIIAVTVIVSLTALTPDGQDLLQRLWLDKAAVANGEWYRLLTVTLVHASLIHLGFNMYALYIVGPLVERIYGWPTFGLMYVLCAAAGSVASYLFGAPNVPSVGASGAIFGLFGVLLAATRTHQPVLDRQSRALAGQIGGLILINLVIGFSISQIDNFAHIGGLLAGLWLGFALVPRNVQTLRDLWTGPAGSGSTNRLLASAVRLLAILAVVSAIGLGLAIGTGNRHAGGTGDQATVVANRWW